VTLGAVRPSVTHETAVVGEAPRSVAVPGSPCPAVAQRCGPAVTRNARARRVTDATGLRIEIRSGSVRLEPPESGVGAWGMDPVAVLAAGSPMADGTGVRLGANLRLFPRERGVQANPRAVVVARSDGPSARAGDAPETSGRVALSAIRSHVPIVWVSVTVSATAPSNREGPIERRGDRIAPLGERRRRRFATSRLVTERTGHTSVLSSAPEVSHGFVVEFGGPLGRDMASAAVSPELPPVLVVLQVAVGARMSADFVLPIGVASSTGRGPVLALQREPGMQEISGTRRREALQRGVALLAFFSEAALVLVFMAARTGELARTVDSARVTPRALLLSCEARVKAHEWKATVVVVVERRLACPTLDVTGGARLVGELSFVRVSMRVAARARILARADLAGSRVTGTAPERRVLAEQSEPRLCMIELGAPP
jgi:hypothetical protein